MYPSEKTRQLSILLRTSRELDIVGDVTATTDNPSELTRLGTHPASARRSAPGKASQGARYVQVSATHSHDPVRGQ